MPLVLSVAPPPARYIRSYLAEAGERGVVADFDVMAQLGFEDEATRGTWLDQVLADGAGVAEDESRFLDRMRTRS